MTGQLSETKRLLDENEEELKSERLKNKSLADGIKKTLGASENSPSPLKNPKFDEFVGHACDSSFSAPFSITII